MLSVSLYQLLYLGSLVLLSKPVAILLDWTGVQKPLDMPLTTVYLSSTNIVIAYKIYPGQTYHTSSLSPLLNLTKPSLTQMFDDDQIKC